MVTFFAVHYLLLPITPNTPLTVDFGAVAFFVGEGVGVGGLNIVGFGVGVGVGLGVGFLVITGVLIGVVTVEVSVLNSGVLGLSMGVFVARGVGV